MVNSNGSKHIDFFAGKFTTETDCKAKQTSVDAYERNKSRRSKIEGTALAITMLIGLGTVAVKSFNSQTFRIIAHDATAVLDRDKSVTHGSDDPKIAEQRGLIAKDNTADVFAFSLEDAPNSSVQTSCETKHADSNDSPWSVAEHYARLYSLSENKLRALEEDLEAATGQVMTVNESFVICVRPDQQPLTTSNN